MKQPVVGFKGRVDTTKRAINNGPPLSRSLVHVNYVTTAIGEYEEGCSSHCIARNGGLQFATV